MCDFLGPTISPAHVIRLNVGARVGYPVMPPIEGLLIEITL